VCWQILMRSPCSNRLLYADIKTYLHELLMKQDQMSMAASIESRVPFLDHKLVEFTSTCLKDSSCALDHQVRLAPKHERAFCPKRFCRVPRWDFRCRLGSGFVALMHQSSDEIRFERSRPKAAVSLIESS